MATTLVRIAPYLLDHIGIYHNADKDERVERLTTTLQFVANIGKDVEQVQIALVTLCRTYRQEDFRTKWNAADRDALARHTRARAAVTEAIERVEEFCSGWGNNHPAYRRLGAMRALFTDLG